MRVSFYKERLLWQNKTSCRIKRSLAQDHGQCCNIFMNNYRDVTPQTRSQQNSIKEVFNYLMGFIVHPIEKIKLLPNWRWPLLLITLGCVASVSGLITGFFPLSVFRIISGAIVSPIITAFTTYLGTLFIFYYFQIFEEQRQPFRKIFTLLFLANIPFFILQIGSELVPPLTLVGFGFTALLLAVGLTENFGLPKRKSIQLISIMYAAVFVIWLVSRISAAQGLPQ